MRRLSTPALLVAASVVVVGAVLIAFLPAARAMAEAFWRGSFGTPNALLSGTLVRAIPLGIVGVGLCIAFRAGMFNIGAEGQLLTGAIAATMVGLNGNALGFVTLPLALLAAAGGGALWAGIAGVLRTRFGVLEVISTIMLNFVAMNLVSYLVRGPLQEPTRVYPQTELLPQAGQLPRLAPDIRLHAGLLVLVAVCVAGWWFFARTSAGFRVRVVGASPDAARSAARIDVGRTMLGAMLASGALAGVAGGIEVTGVTYALYENLSPGYGFSAIAVAILAGLRPAAVLPAAIFFAALETGALGMQRDAGVPSTFAAVLEAVAILLVVAVRGSFVHAARHRLRDATA